MKKIKTIDSNWLKYIYLHAHNEVFDVMMPKITWLDNAGFIWIFISFLFMFSKRYKTYGIVLLFTLLVCAVLVNSLLKPYVKRVRPCNINKAVMLLIPRPTDYSFPSGHTTSSFAAAFVIFRANIEFGIAACFVALLIAFSRLYLYVHYPSDIFGGILLGTGLAILIVSLSHFVIL